MCVRAKPSPKLLRAEIAFRSCVPETFPVVEARGSMSLSRKGFGTQGSARGHQRPPLDHASHLNRPSCDAVTKRGHNWKIRREWGRNLHEEAPQAPRSIIMY